MSWTRKVYFLLTYLVCSVGLIVQVNQVSQTYFEYATRTRVNLFPHFDIRVPSLSACFRVADVIRIDDIKREKGLSIENISLAGVHQDPWHSYYESVKDLSVADIFEYTPDEGTILRDCQLRLPKVDYAIRYSLADCYKQIKIRKFYHRESICYTFSSNLSDLNNPETEQESKWRERLHLEHYTLTDSNYGMIFEAELNHEAFDSIKVMSSYVHTPNSVKMYDSLWAHYVILPSPHLNILISYSSFSVDSMKPPYDTMCFAYKQGTGKLAVLMDRIQEDAVKLLNKSTTAAMIDQPLKQTLLISHVLSRNETLRKSFRKIIERNDIDGHDSCFIKCTIPKITFGSTSTLRLRFLWPDGLHFKVEYKARWDPMDYLIYLCTCVGIWFGISALSLFQSLREAVEKFLLEGAESSKNKKKMDAEQFKREVNRMKFLTEYRFVQMRRKLEESDQKIHRKIYSIQKALNY